MPAAVKSLARPPLYDRLNSLLHTMRCIELQEPTLCTLLHELKTTGKITTKMTKELRAVLDTLPAHGYVEDIEAVEQALGNKEA